MQDFRKPGTLLAAAFSLFFVLPAHAGSVVDFDGLVTDVALSNQFAGLGVLFTNIEASARFTSNVVPVSGPNYASPFWTNTNPGLITFVDPSNSATAATSDNIAFTLNALTTSLAPGWFSGATVDALDLLGNVIGSHTIQPQSVSGSTNTVFFTGQIHALRFTYIANPNGLGALPFDNLTFDTPVGTPEPATFAMAGLALAALGITSRCVRR